MPNNTRFTSDALSGAQAIVNRDDVLARISARDPREDWRPWTQPTRLPASLFTGPIADGINALADDLDLKVRRVADIEADGRDKQAAAQELNARIDAAIEQNAREVGDGTIVVDAQAARSRFLSTHDPETWQKQLAAARAQVEPAQIALADAVDTNAHALAAELRPVAVKVHDDIAAAQAKLEAALAPLRHQHDEITDTLAMLLGRTSPILREDIPIGDYSQVPYVIGEIA